MSWVKIKGYDESALFGPELKIYDILKSSETKFGLTVSIVS